MTPVTISLPSHTRGDTWEGLSIGPVLFDGIQPSTNLLSCRLYFRNIRSRILGYGFQTNPSPGFGDITIVDVVTWHIEIAAQPLPLAAGVWTWDFETTDVAGAIRTLYAGQLTISQDNSNDDN